MTDTIAENAADAFIAATSRIAQRFITDGVDAEAAAALAVDYMIDRMAADRPTLLGKTVAAAVVKMRAGA